MSGVAESEHDTEQAARAWVERELPRAKFPDWVARRPHGTAGAFLFGQVDRGYVTEVGVTPEWEPDLNAPSWDADLVEGTMCWRQRD